MEECFGRFHNYRFGGSFRPRAYESERQEEERTAKRRSGRSFVFSGADDAQPSKSKIPFHTELIRYEKRADSCSKRLLFAYYRVKGDFTMTTLTMAVIFIVFMASYVFFICWLDKIYDQARHNFFFPNSKIEEETKQDRVEKLNKDE